MRRFLPLFAVLCTLAIFTAPAVAQPKQRSSPHETISKIIDGNLVTIVYGRPYSKDPMTGAERKIWGSLVPWNKANRLGADEATLLLTQKTMTLGTAVLPPGAYTLYLIPSERGGQLGISTHIGKWGIPVDETRDLARIELKKTPLDKSVDQLTLSLENDMNNGGGLLKISWEKTQFVAPIAARK